MLVIIVCISKHPLPNLHKGNIYLEGLWWVLCMMIFKVHSTLLSLKDFLPNGELSYQVPIIPSYRWAAKGNQPIAHRTCLLCLSLLWINCSSLLFQLAALTRERAQAQSFLEDQLRWELVPRRVILTFPDSPVRSRTLFLFCGLNEP